MQGFPETLKMEDGRVVSADSYASAKYKELKEFGYSTLTFEEVKEQIVKVIKNESLTIIGEFIKSDLDNG